MIVKKCFILLHEQQSKYGFLLKQKSGEGQVFTSAHGVVSVNARGIIIIDIFTTCQKIKQK